MNATALRIAAIVKADFLVRFRRLSTAVIFVALCISAYLWIPDPSTGKALIQIKEQRALYNSSAMALGTSALCIILLGMIGYYMVSNVIKRDIRTRTGFIIASTTVRNYEYLVGKFLGNAVFLSAIITGFMVSCMIMQLIRGEAPLEPLVFLRQYLLLAPAIVTFISGVAVFFESSRFLSGKFGDLCYFFLYLFTLTFTAVAADKGTANSGWTSYLDTAGLAYVMHQVRAATHENSMAIGTSPYDTSKPPIVFPTIPLAAADMPARLVSTLYPLLFLLPALLFFHRFNPAKLKAGASKAHHGWIGRINSLLKPLTRRALAPLLPGPSARASLGRSILSDAALGFQLNPLSVLLALGFAVAGLVQPADHILPAAFVVLALLLSDISTRENSTGTTGFVFGSPYLKERFVLWKFGSALLVSLIFTAVPMARMAVSHPSSAVSLLIGASLAAAVATSLGSMTSNPKTFIVVSLMFLYLVVNDSGRNPGFDFGGWYGQATVAVKLTYAATALILLLVAEAQYRWKTRRA